MKELLTKRYLRIFVCLICVIFMLQPIKARATDLSKQKDISTCWLKNRIADIDSDSREDFHKLCDSLAVLRLEDVYTGQEIPEGWIVKNKKYNIDELCRIAWATDDDKWREEIQSCQHEDGGYGLTPDYVSAPYDTMLVIYYEAYSRMESVGECNGSEHNILRKESTVDDKLMSAVHYIEGYINEDGGIGYTVHDTSRPELTAELGIAMLTLGIDEDDVYEQFDSYLLKEYKETITKENYIEQTEIARYLLRRNLFDNVEQIEERYAGIQSDDGSVYSGITETIQYILLLRELEEAKKLKLEIGGLSVECSTYVLEAGKKQDIMVNTEFSYVSSKDTSVILHYVMNENNVSIEENTVECILGKGSGNKTIEDIVMNIASKKDKNYKLTITVEQKTDSDKSEDRIIFAQKDIRFNLHEDIVDELVLNASVTDGEDYEVSLSWNDISNDDHRYGYRMFRKTEDGEWETRSIWNGESVRVLNVYPTGGRYLKTWMNTTINASEEIASRGVLDIDEVYFGDFNNDPDKYLKNENGSYKYDVIMIGSADCNGNCDLSEKSYEAALAFTESGRGILFGHDSVVDNPNQVHGNLAKFGDKLGIYYYGHGSYVTGTKVEVINDGFLTSYPWKLSGTLNIPYAHTSGQFVDSTLAHPATKWMRFQGFDEDGDAYLFSRDQYAMIQTGHSNGQATDDERKVLANTLFYLKQLTHETSARDNSFYDESSPSCPVIESYDDGSVSLSAQDYGTDYQYYVEAIGANEDDRHTSNVVSTEALSGIQGFIVGVSDSEDAMPELALKNDDGTFVADIIPADSGSVIYQLPELESGETKYIHIYAIDYAGNVSEETVMPVTGQEKKAKQAYLHLPSTLIATDEDVTINCNSADITGDVYGNSTFAFQGTSLTLNGTASTSGSLSLAGAWFDIADQQENVEAPDIPDYVDDILEDMEGEETEEITAYNSTDITVPTVCKKTTGAWCPDVGIYANLISDKSISFNANTVKAGAEDKVVLCSKEGDISVQATTLTGNGLIYAPNGTVTINVSEFRYTGTIIAKKIRMQMGTCVITKEVE